VVVGHRSEDTGGHLRASAARTASARSTRPGRARSTRYVHPVPEIEIVEATEVTDELVDAFERLVPQLSRSSPPPTRDELAAIVASPASILLIAVEHGDTDVILGSLTLAWFRIPTGVRAWIEDVVVDEAARGKGVGEVLNRHALDVARSLGARTVDLTSRPSREAANRLYQRIGFEPRETNVYRYSLD
jgi:ribosomal protein S18 acetylase RimI-like enzyme